MLVENSEHDRRAFRRALHDGQLSCGITECVRAGEALEQLSTRPTSYDLVVADYKLPGMNGLALCKELLARKVGVPMVMLTQVGSEQLAVEALKAGVDDYVIKDHSQAHWDLLPLILADTVRRHHDRLARRRAEEELRRHHEYFEKLVEDRTAELKEGLRKLAEAELRYRTVADYTCDWEYWENPDGTLEYVSPACERITGYRTEQFMEDPQLCHEIIWPEDKQLWAEHRHSNCNPQEQGAVQFRIRRSDGEIRWIEHVCQPVQDANGTYLGFRGGNRDITGRKRAEEALRESEERYRAVFGGAAEGILVADIETRKLLHANPTICAMLGYTEEELLQLGIEDIYPQEALEEIICEFEAQGRGENNLAPHIPCLRKDGAIIYANINTAKILLDGKECNVGFFADITAQKKVEEVLSGERQLLRTLVDALPDMIFVKDTAGRFLLANKACARNFGLGRPEAMLGKTDFELFPREYADKLRRGEQAILQAGQSQIDSESFWQDEAGRKHWLLTTKVPWRDHAGNIAGLVGLNRDIADRKQAEETLRESEERFSSAFANAAIGMALVGLDGRWLQANHALCELTGYSEPELRTKTFQGITHPDDLKSDLAYVRQMLDGALTTYQMEKRYIHKAGHAVWVQLNVSLVKDTTGRPLYFISQIQDITDRKQAERQLRESEAKYRELVQHSVDAVVSVDADMKVILWNPAAERLFGYTSEEMLGQNLLKVVPERYRAAKKKGFLEFAQNGSGPTIGTQLELAGLRKDGAEVPVELSVASRKVGNTYVATAIMRDIRQRQEARARLQKEQENLQALFAAIPVGMMLIDENTVVRHINNIVAKMVGKKCPAMIDRQPGEGLNCAHLYDDPQGCGHGPACATCPIRNTFAEVLRSGKGIHGVETQATLQVDGQWIRPWIEFSAEPVVINGKPHVAVALSNITERKELDSQLRQAEKLQTIGRLASGIAHEISTPIQYVGDNIHFMQERFHEIVELLQRYGRLLAVNKEGQAHSDLVSEIESAVGAADLAYLLEEIPTAMAHSQEGVKAVAEIVKAVKEFAHPGAQEKTQTDLNRAIQGTLTVARNHCKYVATLETDFDPDLPLVSCLPGEFNQAILNLLVNAADAIEEVVGEPRQEKGLIRVSTRLDSDWAEVRISDTGPGIPAPIRDKIFDPFFTTKKVGQGSGQGLAIARSVVVDKHGGTLALETEEGQGTTFIIRLPIEAACPEAKKEWVDAR